MSDLRIDYSGLTGLVDEGKKQSERREERRTLLRGLPLRTARASVEDHSSSLNFWPPGSPR